MSACPKCGSPIDERDRFCGACGSDRAADSGGEARQGHTRLSYGVETVAAESLEVGEVATLSVDDGSDVAWSSTDASVLRVDSSGTVTAVGPGRAAVVGRTRSGSVICRFLVNPSAHPPANAAEATVAFRQAEVEFSEREAIALAPLLERSASAVTVHWRSADETVVRVDQTGVATAARAGRTTISVHVGAASAAIAVSVLPARIGRLVLSEVPDRWLANTDYQLGADVLGVDDVAIAGRSITWLTSDASVVSVDARGIAHTHTAGRATIIARCGHAEAKVLVDVAFVAPLPPEMADAPAASPAPREPVAWGRWMVPAVLLIGVGVTVWALVGRQDPATATAPAPVIDSTPPTVELPPAISVPASAPAAVANASPVVARIELSVTANAMEAGDSTPVVVRVIGSDGKLFAGVQRIRWEISDSTIAHLVGGQRFLLGTRAGSVRLSVSAGGKTTTRVVTVTPAAPRRLVLELERDRLTVGDEVRWRVVASDKGGGVLSNVPDTVYSEATDIAEVSGPSITARKPGNTRIVAVLGPLRTAREVVVRERASTASVAAAQRFSVALVDALRRQNVDDLQKIAKWPDDRGGGLFARLRAVQGVRVRVEVTPRRLQELPNGAVFDVVFPIEWSRPLLGSRIAVNKSDILSIRYRIETGDGEAHCTVEAVSGSFLKN